MMSNNLSTNRKKLAQDSLKSYWWLALICSIIYFFAGPVFMMLSWQEKLRYSNGMMPEDLLVSQFFTEWFYRDGMLPFYALGMIIATALSVVVFSYLHSKQQVNFYHALPITRTKLFLQRYGVGLVLAYVPLAIMVFLMGLMSGIYGGLAYVSLTAVLAHLGRIFLFMLISYSIGVLAAQFTGTILTHLCLSAVFHFGLVVVLACTFVVSVSTFWGTYDLSGLDWILNTSPCTYWLNYIDQASNYSVSALDLSTITDPTQMKQMMMFSPMGIPAILSFLAISLGLSLVAWWLYQKRPSESAGEPLIYNASKPVFKCLLMYIAASAGGVSFLEIGGKGFFIFGVISFALLIHMFSEVVIHKDFKALLKNLKCFGAFAVAFCLFYGVLYLDPFGYNDYVPKDSTEIATVTFTMPGLDESYEGSTYSSEENVDTILSLLTQVVETKSYRRNEALYGVPINNSATRHLNVTYTLSNGKEVKRQYIDVPLALLEADFAKIYNSAEFKEVNYSQFLASGSADLDKYGEYSVCNVQEVNEGVTAGFNYYSVGLGNRKQDIYLDQDEQALLEASREPFYLNDPYLDLWLDALQKDLQEREFEDFRQLPLYRFELMGKRDSTGGRNHQMIEIYPTDLNSLGVIDKMVADNRFGEATIGDVTRNINELAVYRYNEVSENAQIYQGEIGRNDGQVSNEIPRLVAENKVTLVESTRDKTAMAQLLDGITLMERIGSSGSHFLQLDSTYLLVACTGNTTIEDLKTVDYERGKFDYFTGFFLKGQVPTRLQK